MSEIRRQWKEELYAPFITECLCESHVKPELVNDFFELGKISDDPCFKCNLKCYGFKTEVLNATGDININRLAERVFALDHPLARKCANITERDLCQKSYLAVTCIYEGLSERYPP
ncbi:hypothetical protein ILUMI_09160 [Ignelater luminosus]|uniref:Uncharacterized protein n=1 Tax=Ignelater luminosus TaxID=2038154 RepID=A0A8K0D4S7_IGNLU|nr:hypothetical protein ILUMI_09160 [Ignelater luminosus]